MAAYFANAAFGFLFWAAAARLYRPEEVGLAAGAVSASALLSMLSLLGLDYAMVKFLPHAADSEGVINSSITAGVGMGGLLSLIFVAGLSLWSPGLLSLRQNPLFVAVLVLATMLANAFSLLTSVFLARKNSGLVCAQVSVFGAAKLFFVAVLAASPHAMELVGAWALGKIVAVIYGVVFLLPRVEGRSRPRAIIVEKIIRDMSRFAFANYVVTLVWSAPTLLLPLLVLNTIGREANAYFYVASNLGGVLAIIPMAVSMSLFAHGSHSEDHLVHGALESGKLILALLVPAIALVFVLGREILLFFGHPYSERATELLRVLAVSNLPLAVNLVFFSMRRVQQRMGWILVSAMWTLAVTMSVSAALLPHMGLLATGIGWLAAQGSLAMFIVLSYVLKKVQPES